MQAAAMRLGASVRQQTGRQALRRPSLISTAARQRRVCSASVQPGSPGSQPAGSSAVTLDDLATMLGNLTTKVEGIAETQKAQGTKVEGIAETQKAQGTKLEGIAETQKAQGTKLEGIAETQTAQGTNLEEMAKTQAAQGVSIGKLHESNIRLQRYLRSDDRKLREPANIATVDELLRFISLPGQPASKQRLLRELGPSSQAFADLFRVVEGMMRSNAASLGVQLPATPTNLHDPAAVEQWLFESRALLLAARGKGAGKAAWLPACKALEAYAHQAAGGSTSPLDFLGREEQEQLVIMLLGAWATGRLSESIEMDAEPALEVRGGSVVLDLVEIKTKPADIQKATQQLQAQADILLLALALSNAAVLQHGPPHVLGTVEVAEGPVSQDAKRHWQHQQLTVGSRGPAPKVVMQLRIKG